MRCFAARTLPPVGTACLRDVSRWRLAGLRADGDFVVAVSPPRKLLMATSGPPQITGFFVRMDRNVFVAYLVVATT